MIGPRFGLRLRPVRTCRCGFFRRRPTPLALTNSLGTQAGGHTEELCVRSVLVNTADQFSTP